MASSHQFQIRIRSISLSVIVSLTLTAAKFYGYRITGSAAILSDALESIINVIASFFALGSILFAARPPDQDHPYGHGNIEYFSAGFEGALIILASIGIFLSGWPRIFHPGELPNLDVGMQIILGTAVVNLLMGVTLIRNGKRTGSLTLIADGKHLLTDVYSTVAVLIGLFLVQMTGMLWMDGALACLVGVNILFSGISLMYQSFSGLMNKADSRLLEKISRVINRHRQDSWIDIHQLRAWSAGSLVHIDFHLILPRDFHLEDAHHEAKKLEQILWNTFDQSAEILIHLDPCLDNECPICGRNHCNDRTESHTAKVPWTVETMTMKGGGKIS